MSRLLTTLLLYQSGCYVGKYISLGGKIVRNKDLYFDERMELAEGKRSALEIVRKAAESKLGKLTKADMISMCPTLGKTSVESSIKKPVDEGVLVKHGKGRATFYTKA